MRDFRPRSSQRHASLSQPSGCTLPRRGGANRRLPASKGTKSLQRCSPTRLWRPTLRIAMLIRVMASDAGPTRSLQPGSVSHCRDFCFPAAALAPVSVPGEWPRAPSPPQPRPPRRKILLAGQLGASSALLATCKKASYVSKCLPRLPNLPLKPGTPARPWIWPSWCPRPGPGSPSTAARTSWRSAAEAPSSAGAWTWQRSHSHG